MAATGQTQHYQLPIYNAGDTANYLNSWNGAMQKIDTELFTQDGLIQANTETADNQAAIITKVQGDITQLQTAVTQANGNAVGALNQIQEIVNYRVITFNPVNSNISIESFTANDAMIEMNHFSTSNQTGFDTTITINNQTYYVVGKIDNNNAFRFQPNFIRWRRYTAFKVGIESGGITEFDTFMDVGIYYDGVNTYLIAASNEFSKPNSSHIEYFYGNSIILFNSQPSN